MFSSAIEESRKPRRSSAAFGCGDYVTWLRYESATWRQEQAELARDRFEPAPTALDAEREASHEAGPDRMCIRCGMAPVAWELYDCGELLEHRKERAAEKWENERHRLAGLLSVWWDFGR